MSRIEDHAISDQTRSDSPDEPDPRAITVRVDAEGITDMFGRVIVGGVEAGLQTVLGWFETHAYCADAHLWINPQDNGGVADTTHDRARLVRRPARQVLVVGADPVAGRLRALLRPGHGAWALHQLPEHQTLLEVAEPILGHRTYNMLTREGYRSLDEIAATPDASLINIRNLGPKSLALIRDAAHAHLAATALTDHEATGRHGGGIAGVDTMTTDQLRILWAATVWELQRRGVLTVAATTDNAGPIMPS